MQKTTSVRIEVAFKGTSQVGIFMAGCNPSDQRAHQKAPTWRFACKLALSDQNPATFGSTDMVCGFYVGNAKNICYLR